MKESQIGMQENGADANVKNSNQKIITQTKVTDSIGLIHLLSFAIHKAAKFGFFIGAFCLRYAL